MCWKCDVYRVPYGTRIEYYYYHLGRDQVRKGISFVRDDILNLLALTKDQKVTDVRKENFITDLCCLFNKFFKGKKIVVSIVFRYSRVL